MRSVVSLIRMRLLLLCVFPLLSACGSRLVLDKRQMSSAEMLVQANVVFIGVIQRHQFESIPYIEWNLTSYNPAKARLWRVLRREVLIEMVLRGTESRRAVNVYEIVSTLGLSGDGNSTQDGERDLFLVRLENGLYHVVHDGGRTIFPVTSGAHSRLPLDESSPLWERIALMNWWIERTDDAFRIKYPYFSYADPGQALGRWRTIKLERGLVRHPSSGVRVPACRELLMLGGWGQDECWETLSESDRSHLSDGGYKCCSATEITENRRQLTKHNGSWWWLGDTDRESRRLLTAVSNRKLRAEICLLYTHEYPGDQDTGCLADQPPATIVSERGDLPLIGAWPH